MWYKEKKTNKQRKSMKKNDFTNVWRPLLVYSVFLVVAIAILVSIIVIQVTAPEKNDNNSVTTLYKKFDVPAVRGKK